MRLRSSRKRGKGVKHPTLRLWFGHRAEVEEFFELFLIEQPRSEHAFANGFPRFKGFLGDLGSLVVADNRGEHSADHETALYESFSYFSVGLKTLDNMLVEAGRRLGKERN